MKIDETQIRNWWDVMKAGRGLVEIRILTKGPIYSGIFDNCDSLIGELQQFPDSDSIKGVFYTLNDLNDYCRDWPQYGKILKGVKTASDADIARRSWVLVDIDPIRPSGVSATENEKAQARDVADKVLKLYDIGFPNPKLILDSGNGVHLLWRAEMENNRDNSDILRCFLHTLKGVFNTPGADVDTSVFNPARISKLPGTWARKGDDTPNRPHRMSKILKVVPDDNCDSLIADDLKAMIDHFTPDMPEVSEMPENAPQTPLNADISQVLRDVESCLCQLEAQGIKFPADRDKWHTILCGWYHSLGMDGLDAFLRFSAMWENNNPAEDRQKYIEIQSYPHNDRPASIQSFFALCREYGIIPAYDWRKWQVDITQEQPAPIPLITRDGRNFLSRGNLCAIVGRPKAGKSTLLSAIVATAYTGNDCLGFQSEGRLRVVWFDTEQGPDDSTRVWRGAYHLAGIPVEKNDNLIFLRLLETPLKERLSCIEAVIKETRPDVVIIDGIGDILRNTNDIEESQAVVMEIRRINTQYECGIIAILHINWRDDKARGHIGTILQQKSETIALLEHEAGMDSPSKVIPQLTRKAPFAQFSFAIDSETGLPSLTEGTPQTPPPAIESLLDCIKAGHKYRHKELVEMMMGRGITESNAKKYIGVAVEKGYLIKDNEGYALDDDDLPE